MEIETSTCAVRRDLAQRRYEEVDPSNRLVAATLEKRWNESLTVLNELQKQYDVHSLVINY